MFVDPLRGSSRSKEAGAAERPHNNQPPTSFRNPTPQKAGHVSNIPSNLTPNKKTKPLCLLQPAVPMTSASSEGHHSLASSTNTHGRHTNKKRASMIIACFCDELGAFHNSLLVHRRSDPFNGVCVCVSENSGNIYFDDCFPRKFQLIKSPSLILSKLQLSDVTALSHCERLALARSAFICVPFCTAKRVHDQIDDRDNSRKQQLFHKTTHSDCKFT